MAPRKTAAELEEAARRSRAAMLQVSSPTKRERTTLADTPPDGFTFVAYARDDAIIAAELVETLRGHGVPVVWDRNLRGGERFRKRIGELIERAGAVLVIWSPASVGSDFVIDEAEAGKNAGKLVTCRTAEVRDSDIPFGFRGLHCADVSDIDGLLDSLSFPSANPGPGSGSPWSP